MSLGLGFPKYAGGPLKYADWLGLGEVVEMSERRGEISPLYRASEALRRMAASGGRFYGPQSG